MPTSFIWIIVFCNGRFNCGDARIFKLLKLMQTLRQSTWDEEILYVDRSSMDRQLFAKN
jgi:hypothetical protein